MKKIFLSACLLSLALIGSPQEIILDDLPESLRIDLLDEEKEFDSPFETDTFAVNSTLGYYKGSARTLATDTLYYYHWSRMDSAWVKDHRLVKTYDEAENILSEEHQHWSPQQTWVNGINKTYAYESGSLASVIIQVWHRPTQMWHNWLQKQYTYTENQQPAQCLVMRWHYPTQGWIDKSRKRFEYDETGRLVADTIFRFNPMAQAWHYTRIQEVFYDEQGFRVEQVLSQWHQGEGTWHPVHRTLFANDPSGMPLLVTLQHLRPPLGEWVNVRQEAITYNVAGLQSERILRHWFPEAQDWGNRHRLLFGYDAGLNLDTLRGQVWIPHLQAWKNKSLDDFEYDPNGTLLSRLTQVWHPFHEKWINFRLMELVIDLKHSVAGTGTMPVSGGLLTLSYPNPYRAGNMINIRGQKNERIRVDLYQLNGTRVSSMDVSADSPFTLESRLAPGLYFIRASAGQERVSGKILLLD